MLPPDTSVSAYDPDDDYTTDSQGCGAGGTPPRLPTVDPDDESDDVAIPEPTVIAADGEPVDPPVVAEDDDEPESDDPAYWGHHE